MSYEDFRKDAIENYGSLPNEPNELYKKYYTEIALPSSEELENARSVKASDEVKALVSSIEVKTGLKFDLVYSNSFIKNTNNLISIKKMEEVDDILGKKAYKSLDHKIAAFLNANSRDAIVVDVGDGKKEKMNMLFVNDSHLLFQSFFKIRQGSKLDLFQFYASTQSSASITAPLQEFIVEKGAHLDLSQLFNGNDKSTTLHLSKGSIDEQGKIRASFVYNGSRITKTVNLFDTLGAESSIDATEFVYGTSEQKFDISTSLKNSKERSSTRLSMGAVLDGSSTCQLKGYAKIEKWTKGAFSNINERGILLSEKAHIDALPDMSIDYSDQVSATHSAATSPIDKEILFYMNSRGIEEKAARKMFVASFISKYLSNIPNPNAQEIASSMMLNRMEDSQFGILKDVTPKGIWLTAPSR